MVDPRSYGYPSVAGNEDNTAQQTSPSDQRPFYYQNMYMQYGGAPPMYPFLQNPTVPYSSARVQNPQPMQIQGYSQYPGAVPMHPPGFPQNSNVHYGATLPGITASARIGSLPQGHAAPTFPQNAGTAYYPAASRDFGGVAHTSSQTISSAHHYPGPQPSSVGTWYTGGPQNTQLTAHGAGSYPAGPPYMTSAQMQNIGGYTATTANFPTYLSSQPPRYPPPGTFVMYATRRQAFAETSGRALEPVSYKRPCLIHDVLPDNFGDDCIWLVPMTSAKNGKRKPSMKPNWWQPVYFRTPMGDSPRIPHDSCKIKMPSGAMRDFRRPPIPLAYRPPSPGKDVTALGDTIPELKPGFIWVGDVGEAVSLRNSAALYMLSNSIVSPYYDTVQQTIEQLHAEMVYWKTHDEAPHQPIDNMPKEWPDNYPPPPPPRF